MDKTGSKQIIGLSNNPGIARIHPQAADTTVDLSGVLSNTLARRVFAVLCLAGL
jgi:hypothetical protein